MLTSLLVVAVSIFAGWGFTEMTSVPICSVHEIHNNKDVLVPYECSDVMTDEVAIKQEG